MLAGIFILNHEDHKDRKEKTYRSFSGRSIGLRLYPHQAWNPAHDLAKTITKKPTN
jgi:hypothetical protein